MAGQHGDAPGIIADQPGEAAANLHRSVAVIGQRQNAARVFAPYPDQIRDAVHQRPRLARSRPGEHQHVGLFTVVRNDPLLNRMVQIFDNRAP